LIYSDKLSNTPYHLICVGLLEEIKFIGKQKGSFENEKKKVLEDFKGRLNDKRVTIRKLKSQVRYF